MIHPAIDAFLSALISWNTMNGIKIVSDNHEVPGYPFSTDSNTVKKIIQVTKVLNTLRALRVWKPSRFVPEMIPKNPSNKTTAIRPKY